MWVKLDDQLHSHPKIQRAWRACQAAPGVHLLALSHAGATIMDPETPDGFVPEYFVVGQVPGRSPRRRVVEALVGARLWEPSEGGWVIHDWGQCNPTREQLLNPSRASAGRRGRRAGRRDPTPDPFPSLSSHPSIGEAGA